MQTRQPLQSYLFADLRIFIIGQVFDHFKIFPLHFKFGYTKGLRFTPIFVIYEVFATSLSFQVAINLFTTLDHFAISGNLI